MGDLRSYMPPGVEIMPFKIKEKPKAQREMPKNLTKIKIPSEAPKSQSIVPENKESMLSLEHMLPNIQLQRYTEHVTKDQPSVRAKVTQSECETDYQTKISKLRASVKQLNKPSLILNQTSHPYFADRTFVTPQPELSFYMQLNSSLVDPNQSYQSEPPQFQSHLKEISEEQTQMNETSGFN